MRTSCCGKGHGASFGILRDRAGSTGTAIGDGNGHAHVAAALTAEAGNLDHAGGVAFREGRGALAGIEVDDQHVLGRQGLGVLVLHREVPDLELGGVCAVQVAGIEGLGDLGLFQGAVGRAEDVAGDLGVPVQFGGTILLALAEGTPDRGGDRAGVQIGDEQFSC